MHAIAPIPARDERGIFALIKNKWVQTGLAGIPWVGGPVQTYLAGVVSELDRKKWETYCRSFEARLEQINSEKVDASYFSSEDFALRLRRVYQEVTTGADDVKLSYQFIEKVSGGLNGTERCKSETPCVAK
jgi:hypothetical protein